MDNCFVYREVIPDQTACPKWTEFTLNTGGTQSTLQDFKVAERKGGFTYHNQQIYYTRNRFIYWRVRNDVLELHEESLDITLTNNCVRYIFSDTPVLDGVSICEVAGSIIVLVPTVSSVHRLSFPHPDLIHGREHTYQRGGTDYSAPSIFAEASLSDARNPISFHVINNIYSNSPPPHTSASGLSPNGEDCLFALAYASGSILLVRLNAKTGAVGVTELSEHSDALMPRFLSRALRGRSSEEIVAVSMAMHTIENDTILYALCRDGNARAWSTTHHTCSIITHFPINLSQGAQSHAIKRAVGSEDQLVLGILHCFVSHSVIYILRADYENHQKLQVIDDVPIPAGKDVADFSVTVAGEVWVLLRSAGGDVSLSLWRDRNWQQCNLEVPWSRQDIAIDSDLDAKQTYLDFLFHPGRFSVSVINKALSIYRKTNIISDSGIPMHILKERVCAVVDVEVRTEMRERECTADELSQMQASAWQKFCSCVIEYHESGSRPLGLLVLCHKVSPSALNDKSKSFRSTSESPSMDQDDDYEGSINETSDEELVTSGVVLIKKSCISLVRPMDGIEAIVFNRQEVEAVKDMSTDMLQLISLIIYLDDNILDETKLAFDRCLRQLRSPLQTVGELFSKDLSISDDLTMDSLDTATNVAMNLEHIKNLDLATARFLDNIDVGQPELTDIESIEKSRWLLHLGHLYSSQLGISLAATSLAQIIRLRYDLCRGLLILGQMLQCKTFKQFMSRPQEMSEPILDRIAHLTHCYFLLLWISETPIYPVVQLDSVETSVTILKLKEERASLLMARRPATNNIVTVLHLFLQTSASAIVRLILARRGLPTEYLPVWRHSFLPFLHVLTQLIWPICSNTVFPEFLLFSGQKLLVQEYTRLLSRWCHNNSYTRKFIAACALMDTGEHLKAFDLFCKAAHGVLIDDFLRLKVVKGLDSEERLLVLYYVQVMKLFEQRGLHDLVVDLAETAILSATPDEPELATLHSVSFLHRLELGQYSAAYDAMLANPDGERRRHCLQQLVVTLIDAKKLPILMTFKYDGVRPELERIVEARARSMDVLDNPYYSFLFAYHTERGNMRKAGCVMYEQALRLSSLPSLQALKERSDCILAAINSLSLVKPEDAWIVKPVFSSQEEIMDTDEIDERAEERQVEVLEMKDLRKDLEMCQAKLKLVAIDPDHAPLTAASSHELVAVLANAGLYRDALSLCTLFGVSKGGVLANLAGACVRLDETPDDTAWDWLRENLEDITYRTPSAMAWHLLEILLEEEEPGRDSSLHKDVTTKLLHLGVFLPNFLSSSYKMRNPAELLRLLLAAGRLEEASDLAVEYIEAVLGKGKERFGLSTSLLPQHPAVWLPYNTFDLLQLELKIHAANDSCYAECQDKLNKSLDNYLKAVKSVSEDKMKLLMQTAA